MLLPRDSRVKPKVSIGETLCMTGAADGKEKWSAHSGLITKSQIPSSKQIQNYKTQMTQTTPGAPVPSVLDI
jgi:hypothetical protein